MIHTDRTDAPSDPDPAFPTAAEIDLADALRHRLEERLLSGYEPEIPDRLDSSNPVRSPL